MNKVQGLAFALLLLMPSTAATASYASPSNVAGMLDSLKVSDELPDSIYNRALFKHWIDADKDGCDTRAEVLIEESLAPVRKKGKCTIVSGRWLSIYDDKTITLASRLDIDHLIPLSEAWKSGADAWSQATRQAFANDLGVTYGLVAVSATSNRSKGDKDAAHWLPSSVSAQCNYVGAWIAQKYRWSLRVDSVEKTQLAISINNCGASAEVPIPEIASPPIDLPPSKADVTSIKVEASKTSLAPGESVQIILTALDASNNALRGKVIKYANRSGTISGDSPATDSQGRAEITLTMPASAKYVELVTFRADSYGYGAFIATITVVPVESSPTPKPTLSPTPSSSPSPSSSASSDTTGARARCKDGALSYSANRSGTCSGHGGVAVWFY